MKQSSLSIRNTFGASLGTALEFYDFSLYGIFSVLFSSLFFPQTETAVLASLFIYAIGSFLRPLGGLVFGFLADTYGRKQTLMLSIFIMAVATFSMGCIPVYADIGMASIILLVVFRCVQGFSAGGEFNNTTIYALESNYQHPGLYSGVVVASATVGTLIAVTLSGLILKIHHPDAWRIPFIVGGIVGFVGCYYRSYLSESPAYEKEISTPSNILNRVSTLIQHFHRPLLKTIAIGGFASMLAFTIFNYVNIYLSSVIGFNITDSILLSAVGIGGFIIFTPLFGLLGDYVDPRNIMRISAFTTICSAYFIYMLLSSKSILNIVIAQFILTLLSSSFSGSAHLFLIKLFPQQVRCLGVSFGFTVGIALFGGTMPFISNSLIHYTGNVLSPSFYLMFCGLMATLVLMSNVKLLVNTDQPVKSTA